MVNRLVVGLCIIVGVVCVAGTLVWGISSALHANYVPRAEPVVFPTILTCYNGTAVAYQGAVDVRYMGTYTHFIEESTGASFRTTLPCIAIETTQAFIDRARAGQEQADASSQPTPEG
jgi:hypothetical protein